MIHYQPSEVTIKSSVQAPSSIAVSDSHGKLDSKSSLQPIKMSQVVECSINSKGASEMKVLFKFPVLDCGYSPQATQGPVTGLITQLSVHVEISKAKEPTADMKVVRADQYIKQRVQDHMWSRDTCVKNGCKECCGCVAQQFQCDRCAEENIFVLSKHIHEDTLHDWHSIEPAEGDGYIEEDIEVVTYDMASNDLHQEPVVNFEQETFEIVDGFVETELVDGLVVKVWKDTMLMEDCGHQGKPKPLSFSHGLA